MENREIAEVLIEIADLLELQGANPFRVRAYRNGARTVADTSRPLAEMVEAGEDLTELPGIGKDLASYITELIETGESSVLEEAREKVPSSVRELMRIDGVGPKRAMLFYEELGVETVPELEEALEEGEVGQLPGFGPRSLERLRQGIEDYKRHTERFRLSDADRVVAPLLEYMGAAPGLVAVETAGSYRRRVETVGDIDLIVIGDPPEAIMDHFESYPEAARTEIAGPSRGTIVLKNGLHIDLRILPEESYGAALHYFIGSKAHNIAVRKLGIERGLKINEYGVFRVEGTTGGEDEAPDVGEKIGGAREEDIFEAVGMVWVPPELREDRGEIEAALEDDLPDLVVLDDIRGDLHMHSRWSDGEASIEEMARACAERGYEYMAITDHSVAVRVANGLDPKRLEEQWEEIDEVRKRVPEIEIFRGMEVDILPDGSLDLPDEYLDELDLVIVAVHSRMGLPEAEMTDRIIRGISHPAVDILAHPTGRLINRRNPYAVDLERVMEAARERGVALELNSNPARLDLSDVHLRRARELGVRVAVNTDAHRVANLDLMGYGIDQARRGWLEAEDLINSMGLPEFRRWLEREG